MALQEIPFVRWPETSGLYKCVQFEGPERKPYLRFGETPGIPHQIIVLQFAQELKIPHVRDTQNGGTIRLPPESRYFTVGAGKGDVRVEEKRVKFQGASLDYLLSILPQHLQKLREVTSDWNFY